MPNLSCDILICSSALILVLLTFSSEIHAILFEKKLIGHTGFKIALLLAGILTATFGIVKKQQNNDTTIRLLSKQVDNLQRQFIKELAGGDFPVLAAKIDSNTQRLVISVCNYNKIPIHYISVTVYDLYAFAKKGNAKQALKSGEHPADGDDDEKFMIVQSIKPKGRTEISQQDISTPASYPIHYKIAVTWQNGNYTAYLDVSQSNETAPGYTLSFLYHYGNQNYSEQEFLNLAKKNLK
ncbi:hypothetical protein SAMN05216464_103206 [Mucilaginibacter pineti]|uniref:Uncharacterized protein n=1 Tax=Mucilaginibacter pineti TaxID=1391627 RepID=A0A1G6Z4T8_9SPHI|nr:hypothetical protein [Mucilaginibacter pineti]SDD97303.1 hypothetical protein SAMN05216464_103206 [Mucilaginibacter pineti]